MLQVDGNLMTRRSVFHALAILAGRIDEAESTANSIDVVPVRILRDEVIAKGNIWDAGH